MAKRRHFSGQEKVEILRRHLLEDVAVSDLCDEYNIHHNLFYRWKKQFFEKGAAAFENGNGKHERALKKKNDDLQERTQPENE